MKNIAPLSPPEEVVPEASHAPAPMDTNPALHMPVNGASPDDTVPGFYQIEPSGEPPAVESHKEAPPILPQTPQSPHVQSLYPEPQSFEERRAVHELAYNIPGSAKGTPFSQYFIPVIIGIYALYALYTIAKGLFFAAGIGALGGFNALSWAFGGSFNSFILTGFVIMQLVVLLIISYKIFKGSMIALALLSGVLFLYLPQKILTYTMALPLVARSGSASLYVTIAAEFAIAGLLVMAWTIDKKHYYK